MRDYHFGNFVQELREQRNLSQYQLGMLVGVSDKAVSKWENGSSKPQSHILCKLSTVLGVTVDELLAGQYHTSENEHTKKTSMLINELWHNAYRSLKDYYGEIVPMEILSRYLSEYTKLRYTDWIIYYDLFSRICARAWETGEIIRIYGGIGSSLVAFVMGATEINPLPPHYYCPCCRKVEFASDVPDGWDLAHKYCICGEAMKRDGHNLPFESLLPSIHRQVHFDIALSHGLYEVFKDMIFTCLKGKNVITLSQKKHPDLKTIVILNGEAPHVASGQELLYEEYYDQFKKYPIITLSLSKELDHLSLLAKNVQVCPKDIPFNEQEILEALCGNNTQKIPEFKEKYIKELIANTSPHSFHDLIQILGLAHGTGIWTENMQRLIQQGIPVARSIAYRDDIFHYLQDKLARQKIFDTGLACKVMEDVSHGMYAKNGLPEEMKHYFAALGVESWFTDSIEKIQYVFPKAQGVQSVKYASMLMWYKLHYSSAENSRTHS